MTALALARPALPTAPAYLAAAEKFNQICADLQSGATQTMTHSEVEKWLERDGRELLRRLLQAHFDERGPGLSAGPVVDAEGQRHATARLHTRHLESLFGTVEVTRTGYGGLGQNSLHPLDAALALPRERYSHAVRERVAQAAAQVSFDEVVAQMEHQTGAHVPKRQVEELVQRAAQDFTAFYDQGPDERPVGPPAADALVVLSSDGKGVPLRACDLRPVTRAAAAERQHKLQQRRSRGEKSGGKRMSTVASVYTTAPFVRTPEQILRALQPAAQPLPDARPRPQEKRVWASLVQTPQAVIRQAFAEAARRNPQHQQPWALLVDGSAYQLKIIHLVAREQQVQPTIVLDFIHVCEYVWGAAWSLFREGDPAAEAWVQVRLREILRGRSRQVAAGMRRSATVRGLTAKERTGVDKCANYLGKYRAYLHYDKYLAAGLPIATGVIEGACRYLVKDRMELTGARWRLAGAEAVLCLRSLRASGDWEAYWAFHLQQEYQRHHASQYALGKVPALVTSTPAPANPHPHLRLVT
jgi:hypothetical protein